MNNIIVRTLSGAVFISLILVPLFFPNPLVASCVFFGFMLIGLIEYGKLFKSTTIVTIDWKLNTIFSVAISLLAVVGLAKLSFPILFACFPLIMIWNLTELFRKREHPLINIAVSVYGFIYVCIPFILAILLHGDTYNESFPYLVGMFVLIWTNDTFAFLVGKFFGKTKLFERISPKKTWEGTIGGIVCTIGMAFALSALFDPEHQLFWVLSVLVIAPGAIFGDLLESMFKRSLNIKDSGTIMPGHGGILDRFDAALFTIPLFVSWYLFYVLFLKF